MKNLRQENGYSMLLVIFATVLISILGLTLITINTNSLITSKNEEVDQSVYYVAEAGLNVKTEKLISIINSAFKDTINNRKVDFNKELYNYEVNYKKNYSTNKVNYCGFIYTYNFKENYKSYIENLYLVNTKNLQEQFTDFKNPDSIANFSIKKKIYNDELTFDIESTGSLQEKTRTLLNSLSIDFKRYGINTVVGNCSGGNTTPPTLNGILLPPKGSSEQGILSIYVADSEVNINGTGNQKLIIGNIDINKINNYLPSSTKYKNMIKQLVESAKENYNTTKNYGTYKHNLTTQNFTVNKNDTLTLIVTTEQFKNISTLTVKGGGILNIVVTEGNPEIKGTINSNDGSKINLIIEETPILYTNEGFNYNSTNIIALNSGNLILEAQKGHVKKNLNGGNIISNTKNISLNASKDYPNAGICTPFASYSSKGKQTLTSIVVNKIKTINGFSSNIFNPNGNPCDLGNFFDFIDTTPPVIPNLDGLNEAFDYVLEDIREI
ncbi:hypothetical protein [Solibacillus sp. FSL K6-1126]|uniref:hypothetical protein n=1 Tax=Solibacillus sp. FSL K6-1126 TaxID=2921463 RepID=UPI0030FBD461